MNTYKFLLLQIALLFFVSNVFTQETKAKLEEFPLYEEIYSFINREIKSPCSDCEFDIAKKIDGYYLVVKRYKGMEVSNLQYFKVWDAKTKNYSSPRIDDYLIKSDVDLQNGLTRMNHDPNRFDLMYVFGYPNWINDINDMLSNNENLTAREYEMLARANSEKAADFIHPNQFGNNLEETKGFEHSVYEKISAERIEQFINYAKKSLSYYQQIKNLDPNYQTIIITDIDLKIAHDLMHYYSYLMSVKEPEAAAYFLNLVEYNEGYLSYARNYLDDCPPNSILITYGDSDTYPLWYLQDKLGYRKDVIVMNNSLMQTDWYLAMTKERSQYKSALSKTDFINFHQEAFILQDSDTLPFITWINLAKSQYQEISEVRLKSNARDNRQEYVYLPSSCEISIKGENTTVDIGNSYVRMLEIMTIDLIHSNSDRAICTTAPAGFSSMNLYRNLAKRGAVYELFPTQVARFENEETINFSMKNVKRTNAENIYLMKDLGTYKLSYTYIDLLDMDESPVIQKELFNYLIEQFPIPSLIRNFDTRVLASFSESAAHINSELNTKFKNDYAQTAIDFIEKVNINSSSIQKDIIDLQNIFRIYAEANWQLMPKKTGSFSKIEKRVLNTLLKKIIELSESDRYDNLNWTSTEIDKLVDEFNEIKI